MIVHPQDFPDYVACFRTSATFQAQKVALSAPLVGWFLGIEKVVKGQDHRILLGGHRSPWISPRPWPAVSTWVRLTKGFIVDPRVCRVFKQSKHSQKNISDGETPRIFSSSEIQGPPLKWSLGVLTMGHYVHCSLTHPSGNK